MRCLFVTHMWGDAAPDTGESVTIPHLIETFDEWGKGTRELVWTDVAHHNGKDVRVAVCEAAEDFRPDVVVLTPIPSAALADLNVPADVMRSLPCRIVSVFFDLAKPEVRKFSAPYAAASDLCINVDGDQRPIGSRFLSLWAARASRPPKEKTIDVCFMGARANYPDRIATLARLTDAGINIVVGGGRNEDRRSFDDYLDTIDRSLIALNFSKTPAGFPQLKARVFEALSGRCCIVEDANPITPRYLRPGLDYVAWGEGEDLAAVISGLLGDRDRTAQIAETGHQTFKNRYSATSFWNAISSAL